VGSPINDSGFREGATLTFPLATHFDFGKHESFARPDAALKWYTCLYVFEIFYAPAIAVVKISILLFYGRIFPSYNKWFRRLLYFTGATVCVWWIICQFFVIFECQPIHYFWDRSPSGGRCLDIQAFFLGQAIPNIFTDVILLAMPIPIIWRLHLPKEQKMGLSGIFLLGHL